MAVPKRTIDYDEWLLTQLKDPDAAAAYLNEHLIADGVDADELFLIALRNVAQAHGVSRVAAAAELGRESLYKALSAGGNPKLSTLIGVLKAVGLQLSISVPTAGRAAKESA